MRYVQAIAEGGARDRQEMVVVREKKHLSLLVELAQHGEPRCGSVIVEFDEQVVGDERQSDAGTEV